MKAQQSVEGGTPFGSAVDMCGDANCFSMALEFIGGTGLVSTEFSGLHNA